MSVAPAQKQLAADKVAFLKTKPLADVLAVLNGGGEETRAVGGAVRNLMLGLPLAEIDLATTMPPKAVIDRVTAAGFKAVPTGIEHGTITVVADGKPFEVTSLREDIETDGRHAVVRFGRDWKNDAARRDFTINAMSLSGDGAVHDYCGGLADVEARRVRFIGNADRRIAEDYLRVLRFFRFFAAYGEGDIDREGYLACARARDKLGALSRERIRAEILKTLTARRAADAITAMADAGIYDRVFANAPELPALARLALIEQSNEIAPDAVRRLAAVAVRLGEDAVNLRERLRLSNDEYRRLASMADRWWRLAPSSGEAYAKETLYRIGAEEYADRALLSFSRADVSLANEAWGALLSLPQRWTPPRFPLSADDFIKRGVEKGPKLGRALARAEIAWIAADFPWDEKALSKIADDAVPDVIRERSRLALARSSLGRDDEVWLLAQSSSRVSGNLSQRGYTVRNREKTMRRFIRGFLIFALGGLFGIGAGFAAGIWFFPYIFPLEPVNHVLTQEETQAQVLAEGTFIHANPRDPIHWGKGSVSVYKNMIYLKPDFEVGPGPDYRVLLVPKSGIKTNADVREVLSKSADLGQIQAFKGGQRYAIPPNVNLDDYKSVVIWCRQFGALISPATLDRK